MFYTLNRILRWLFVAFWLAVLAYVYQQRAVFYPLGDLAQALSIRKDHSPTLQEDVRGQVSKVSDEFTFQLKDVEGSTYSLRLTGLDLPAAPALPRKDDPDPKKEAKTYLEKTIGLKTVRVSLTVLSEQKTGAGLVFLGETNVNVAMVRAGRAQVNRDYLKGLPFAEIYALVQAERLAQEENLGIWSESNDSL